MKITFLNVGHGDCTVIEHKSGRLTVVDINNGSEIDDQTLAEVFQYYNVLNMPLSAHVVAFGLRPFDFVKKAGYGIDITNPIEFLVGNYPGRNIFRYIQTHPHLDHMRGIEQLKAHNIDILNFWDTNHFFTPDLQTDEDRDSWNEYKRMRESSNSSPTVLRLYCDQIGSFWNQGDGYADPGDDIEILHPNLDTLNSIQDSENINNLSYVLRVTLGKVRIILAGDAESTVWDDLVARYGDDLKCDVLKASHHGRDSGYHAEAMSLMKPQYTIVSVGKKPETDASNKYRRYSANVWSTRWKGNIQVTFNAMGEYRIDPQYNR